MARGTIGLPWKLDLLPVLDVAQGFPFSRLDDDWNYVGARNEAGRFPTFIALDIQIQRAFGFNLFGKRRRLTLGARLYNITDHFNPRDVQQHVNSPNFGAFYNTIERKFRTKIDLEF